MRRETRVKWERANVVASCPCYMPLGGMAARGPEVDWASDYEHWNPPSTGHLVAASLILDGVDHRELP